MEETSSYCRSVRIDLIKRLLHTGFVIAALTLAASISACGSENESKSGGGGGGGTESASGSAAAGRSGNKDKPDSEYEEVLLDLRDAAAAGEIYDAYGFAEYMPRSQRAAIDAFCFVAERLLDGGEIERFGEPAYVAGQVRARARIEFDHGDPAEIDSREMATARRAIRKLRSVIDYEAIDQELAGNYVTACYNRTG
jgi:hypothetical protein